MLAVHLSAKGFASISLSILLIELHQGAVKNEAPQRKLIKANRKNSRTWTNNQQYTGSDRLDVMANDLIYWILIFLSMVLKETATSA